MKDIERKKRNEKRRSLIQKKMGKKGIFFTLVSILLLGLVMFGMSFKYFRNNKEKTFIIETRVDSMDKFINDIQTDLSRAMYTSGFRSILALEEAITTTGDFLDDPEELLAESFFNGTVDGNHSPIMENNTFYNWTAKMEGQALSINLNLSFIPDSITFFQETPWTLGVEFNVTLLLTDKTDIASLQKKITVNTSIEIYEFEDPIYRIYTNALVLNTIIKSPYENNFTNNTNTSNLGMHVNESYYVNSSTAPDFLKRMKGDLTASPQGIESFIDRQEFIDNGVAPIYTNRSHIDYIYWNASLTYQNFSLTNMPEKFRIDNMTTSHLDRYNITHITIDN